MKVFSIIAILALTASIGVAADLPRSTPEAEGVSSAGILSFVEAADKSVHSIHSFMLVRHGKVVAEGWWSPQTPQTEHAMASLSKSFTSTAVGLAIAEGKLSLDDEILKFFPDDAPPEPSNNLKAMRVRDLLSMSTGHETEPKFGDSKDVPWTKIFLAHPVPHKPGTHFLYDTPATYMLSAVVQKVTGQTVFDYLKPRLFEPLGIENMTWGASPQGISLGGYGLKIHTEDIAKLGELYLQKGEWNGKQLLPASWVEAATKRQTSNGSNPKSDWEQGYGYFFWRCRYNAFRGDGAGGQFCIVMPDQDAVLALTSADNNMQGELNVVWDNLFPAIHPSPLPADKDAAAKLKETLAKLSISTRLQVEAESHPTSNAK
ncbi:MAG: penicillin-binding protein beta-lactamase class [Phycisphaerales bacterium]|nr:penicillin-binding protein beta-lactamase class [Phycisphaerales bacterium]